MGRKHDRGQRPAGQDAPEVERTLAAAEEDERLGSDVGAGPQGATRCICGSAEFLLEAYLHVVDGVPRPDAVEVETLTCPECSREYEAIQAEGNRILRGEFRGYADQD